MFDDEVSRSGCSLHIVCLAFEPRVNAVQDDVIANDRSRCDLETSVERIDSKVAFDDVLATVEVVVHENAWSLSLITNIV